MKPIFIQFSILLLFLFPLNLSGQVPQGKIRGKITHENKASKDLFIEIKLFREGHMFGVIPVGDQGAYNISFLEPGNYSIEIWTEGEKHKRIDGILIGPGETLWVNERIDTYTMDKQVITASRKTIFDVGEVIPGIFMPMHEIKENPVRDITDLALLSPGVTKDERGGGGISVRGARSGATQYYIDGVKVIGDLGTPNRALGSIKVMTGGIPAEFGDTVGGVIAINTHNLGMRIK